MGLGGGEGISGSPPRRGSKAAGRFQRRLEEASAEVAAESATAPQIVAAAAGETETAVARLSSGGGASADGLRGGSTKTAVSKTWEDDQLQAAAPLARSTGDDGARKRWAMREDRRLERLVRECVFDFDLVAAQFFSGGDVGDGDGGEGDGVLVADAAVPRSSQCNTPVLTHRPWTRPLDLHFVLRAKYGVARDR